MYGVLGSLGLQDPGKGFARPRERGKTGGEGCVKREMSVVNNDRLEITLHK